MKKRVIQFNSDIMGLVENFTVSPVSYECPYKYFLIHDALKNQNSGKSATHVLCEVDEAENPVGIIGYVTLKASGLKIKELNNITETYPAIEIAHLAIDRNFRKKGFGTSLLDYVLFIADELRRAYIGVEWIVTVAAPDAINFYAEFGFVKSGEYYNTVPLDYDYQIEGLDSSQRPAYMQLLL
jgi:GNAT superfamily N-acetyltransferase